MKFIVARHRNHFLSRGTINVLLFKESVFEYFIRPKKTIPNGNAEFVDGKQVRLIGQPGMEC